MPYKPYLNVDYMRNYILKCPDKLKAGMKSFNRIASVYDVKVEKQKKTINCYCFQNKTIYLNADEFWSNVRICNLFSHELAHRIQQKVCEHLYCNNVIKSFQTYLKFERAADRLAYFIFKEYFDYYIHHSDFRYPIKRSIIEKLKDHWIYEGRQFKIT